MLAYARGVHAQTALKKWLTDLPEPRLAALLEARRLPQAAGYEQPTSFDELAAHLLTDVSVAHGLHELNVGELQLLDAIAGFALVRHGPVPPPPFTAFMGAAAPVPEVEPYDRLVPVAETSVWLEKAEGVTRRRIEAVMDGLVERALLLPAPAGQLALPASLHAQAAELAGYGRPAGTLLSRAFHAPEIRQIATTLCGGDPRTRDEAQDYICWVLSEPPIVRDLLASAPRAAHELVEGLVQGPPQMLTHCFLRQHTSGYGASKAKFVFRPEGSGDEGTDWLAAHGMVVPVGEDLVEMPYEVSRALREDLPPELDLDPVPPRHTALLPRGWDGLGAAAAGAAAWRAELVLRELAAQPVAVRKAGGVAVRDTRRLAKAAGADGAHARLWLDLAVNAGLAAPKNGKNEEQTQARGRRSSGGQKPPARVLPSDRYDAWAAALPAAKLLPLVAAWAVVPEAFTYWPDDEDPPVALTSPQDPVAVPLRHGVLQALATLPDDHGLALGAEARRELLCRVAWFQPALTPVLLDGGHDGDEDDAFLDVDVTGVEVLSDGPAADADIHQRLDATLSEAELLGVIAHGALTDVGRAVLRFLDAGAARHFPAVPGASADLSYGPSAGTDGLGDDLAAHPGVAAALAGLRSALYDMLLAPAGTARFQADSTATVTGTPAPELAELLSAVGDIESEGHAVVWRITPASLRRAYDAGWDAEEVHARLSAVADGGGELPQPLAYTIQDTARGHGRLRVVRSACCVRSDDTGLIEEVAHARGLTRLRLRRIAPTVLISTAGEQETLAALRTAGYAPTLEAETGTTVLERAPGERARSLVPTLDERYAAGAAGAPATARALARSLTRGR